MNNSDIELVASAAIEIAATDFHLTQTKAGLLSTAMTLLLGAVVKVAFTSGLSDLKVVHEQLDSLWDGASLTGNSPGGDS